MNAIAVQTDATSTAVAAEGDWIARLGPERLFWAFIAAHLLVFTLLPWGLYANLPLDCIEMHSWGQQWEWGYHKHPPLPAWIARGVTVLAGGSPVGMYLAACGCVVVSFWAAWRLGRAMMSPTAALLGVVLLECCYYFNFEAMLLNNNTVLYPLWALSVLAFYHALCRGQLRYWIAFGVCVGLGMLTKYAMGILPAAMLVFMLFDHRARAAWRTPGPYLAAVVGLLIVSPHLWWAVEHDFPTLQYASARTAAASAGAGQWGRIWFPVEFAVAQWLALLPMSLVAIPMAGMRWRVRRPEPHERFDRNFLAAMVFGPFVIHLLIAAVLNAKLHSMYGSHLWTFAGLLLVFGLRVDFRPARQRRVLLGCATMGLVFIAATVGRITLAPPMGLVHREHFPGRELAREVERVWSDVDDGPLPVVAGEGWLAGNVAFYGDDRPTVYGIMGTEVPPEDRNLCPWMDDAGLARRGGVYLWDADRHESLPEDVARRLPGIEPVAVLTVSQHSSLGTPPIRVGIARVRPRGEAVRGPLIGRKGKGEGEIILEAKAGRKTRR